MALGEGEVGTGTGSIDYTGVTSCTTVTCLLEDGTTVGGHLSLQQVSGSLDSTQVLPAMKDLIGSKKIVSVVLAGKNDSWNPKFLLEKPLLAQDGTNNYEGNVPGTESLWSAIGEKLGLDGEEVYDTQDKSSSFTITPAPPTA